MVESVPQITSHSHLGLFGKSVPLIDCRTIVYIEATVDLQKQREPVTLPLLKPLNAELLFRAYLSYLTHHLAK